MTYIPASISSGIDTANASPKNGLKYYHSIAVAFIMCFLTSNLAAVKIFSIGGVSLPAGIFVFPLIYVLNDVLTEVYGFTASRKVIWTALLCNLFMTSALVIACYLPPSDFWNDQDCFEAIFLMSPRIFFASMLAYVVGEGINAFIISSLKLRFSGKYFVSRAIFSTSIGVLIETSVFTTVAFAGYLEIVEIIKMIFIMSSIKVFYEFAIMPITTRLVGFLKSEEELDVYEQPSIKKMLPFHI